MRIQPLEDLPYVQIVNGKPRIRVPLAPRLWPLLGAKNKTKAIKSEIEYHTELARIKTQIEAAEAAYNRGPTLRVLRLICGSDAIYNGVQAALANPKPEPKLSDAHGHHTRITVQQAIDYLLLHVTTKPKDRALRDKAAAMHRMLDYLDKPDDLTQVTTTEIQKYKEYLIKTVGNTTARHNLATCRRLFNMVWANNHDLPENPFSRILLPASGDGTPRLAFSDAEARLIWSKLDGQPAHIEWPNRIAAYTGAIMSEIADATTADVTIDDGIPVFWVRDGKTKYRIRVVPLHHLIADRLLAYAETIRQQYGKDGPLFPRIKPDRDGSRAAYMSNINMKFLRKLGIEDEIEDGEVIGLRTHRSWRKWFSTELEDIPMSEDRKRYLCGHAPIDVHAKNYKEHPPHKTKSLIDAIPNLACN